MPEKITNAFELIIKQTGKQPSECSCNLCKMQCKHPCIGTPEDMERIFNAGYGNRLAPTCWAAGIAIGITDRVIEIFAPRYDEKKESCTFFTNGLCELHEKGLKPTEGKLSHHTTSPANFVASKSIAWNVAKTWI